MNKILVAYFSATGTTRHVARVLSKIKKADLFEILPDQPYTEADLDWRNEQSRSTVEMKDPSCRPAIASKVENIKDYDTIFLGFPLWWRREPSIIDTFVESYDLSGKTIIPFCTSGGNDIPEAYESLRNLIGADTVVQKGCRLGGDISEEDLIIWTAGLNLD